jgi:DinB superfamily
MNAKDFFLEQLIVCHNESNWFVSFQNAISGLTAEQASWKNNQMTNSIWEIVNHLIFYNQKHLNRLKDNPVTTEIDSNDSTFRNIEELSWDSTVTLMDDMMSDWINTIKECSEETFNRWASYLVNLTIHMAYHTGQIVHIRKEQGSWDLKQGVH